MRIYLVSPLRLSVQDDQDLTVLTQGQDKQGGTTLLRDRPLVRPAMHSLEWNSGAWMSDYQFAKVLWSHLLLRGYFLIHAIYQAQYDAELYRFKHRNSGSATSVTALEFVVQ